MGAFTTDRLRHRLYCLQPSTALTSIPATFNMVLFWEMSMGEMLDLNEFPDNS
jgi:hypothetical protein